MRHRFYEFIRGFRIGSEFVYRDMLRLNWTAGVYKLEVDLGDLTGFDERLSSQLLQLPEVALPLFEAAANQVIGDFRAAQEERDHEREGDEGGLEQWLAEAGLPAQGVQVLLRSASTPLMLRQLESTHVYRLVQVPGIIVSASRVQPKATVVTISCTRCGNSRVIRTSGGEAAVRIPRNCQRQPQEAGEPACPPGTYVIKGDECRYIDHQKLKLQEPPEELRSGDMPRHLLLSCDRYLVDTVVPGSRVLVVGVYSLTRNQHGGGRGGRGGGGAGEVRAPFLHVVGIQVNDDELGRTSALFPPEEEEEFIAISRRPGLYQDIAASIAPSIYGHPNIKCAIACQLFGGARKYLPDGMRLRGDINVLLVGDPGTAKSQLLKFTEKIAPIGVYTSGKGSSAAGLTASVIRDASSKEFYLEGGAMVLADGGIVCIDEFDKMDQRDRVAIHEAMEQQTISIAKAGITTMLNTRTSVLAAANPIFGRYDDLKHVSENIEFQSTVLSRFDMIFLVKDTHNVERDKRIARHVLDIHSHNTHSSPFAHQQLKRYILYCRTRCSPRLSPAAADKLSDHYVTIRSTIRAQGAQGGSKSSGIPITVRQLEAIVRISESLAKMTLSPTVIETHVDEAIRLFKVSTMEAATTGVLAPDNLPEDLMREINQIEEILKRRVPINAVVAKSRLLADFMRQGYSERALLTSLHILAQRQEFEMIQQGTRIRRRR